MERKVPDDLMPIAEAARHIGRPVVTVRHWVSDGRVQGYRRGGKLVYVSLKEVEDYDSPKPIEPAKSVEK